MKRLALLSGLILAVVLGLLWLSGGLTMAERWVLDAQRQVQSALAGAVRAIKGGQPGALTGLLAVCFGYGLVHAAGPGHGKVLIGGYGIGRRVPVLRLSGLALVASLAQAAVAVALVYAGVALLGWTRQEVEGTAEQVFAPIGLAAIGAVGLWLMWRGGRGLWRARTGATTPETAHIHATDVGHGHSHHGHSHEDHAHDPHPHPHLLPEVPTGHVHDAHCGHAHGPSLAEVEALTGWRDTAALIIGIALRPCSGALFLLILTWQLGIAAAGIAGTFAMGLGTACVTIAVAGLAVWAREGAFATLSSPVLARALPLVELLAGATVALIAVSLLSQTL